MAKIKAVQANEARLKTFYKEKVVPELMKELGYKNIMQVPYIEKIVVSVGVAEAVSNKKILDVITKELGQITGQHAIKTKAHKSIANFKIRQGMDIGAKVTLRGRVMYEFLDRLINIALPRVKDFRGVNAKAFDGRGNYSLGITEQIIFPEINFDEIEAVSGLNVAFVTTAKTDEEARQLLKGFGMPFEK
ncbi:MAG: 50S ribosomal protein L5 [Spirochaetaceae bacterium]|nr:50S ribosomal protein L5 [Spirochaetaceae bacterium]